MVTTATRPRTRGEAPRHTGRDGSTRTGTGTLVRFMLRRDRVKLPLWVGGLGLFVVYLGTAFPVIAPTEQDLRAVSPLVQQPVGRMFTGPGYGMEDPTYERFFAAGYVPYLVLLAALMNIMLIARHTRLEEQTGRSELVRANVTGRHAPLTAALVVAVVANLAATVVVAAMAMAYGFAPTGSWLVGAQTGLVGMAFAGLTAVTVQLTENSRAAAGMAGIVLGVSWALRAVGDMAQLGGSALSWASPLGWAAQTAPYVLDRWWPLLPLVAVAAVGVAVAFVLQSRRDFGAGLMPQRAGRPEAGPGLGSPFGVAVRLQRGAVIAWGAAILLLGVIDGAFAQVMLDTADELPPAIREMFGAEQMLNGYLAFLALFSGYVAAAYVVFAVQTVRSEELHGRAELLLATPVSRTAWAGAHYLAIAAGLVLLMVVSGVGTGIAAGAATGDWSLVWSLTLAHLNAVPPVLVVLGLGALLFGWVPQLLAPVGWALVGLVIFVGNFGEMMDLPGWVMQLSPLSHVAQMPVEDFAVTPVLVLTVIAAVGVVLGLVGLRRRAILTR